MALKRTLCGLLVVICVHMLRLGNGDVYSAIFRLKMAFKEEIKTTKMVLESLKTFDKRIAADGTVKEFAGFIEKTRAKHSKIKPASLETYMENPINIYHVIKRMVNDWPEKVESLSQVADMDVRAFQASLETQMNTANLWPRTVDFEVVTLQVISMQAIYLLNITEFATGTLNGTRTDPLTLDEIFSIGRTAYDRDMFYEASLWFRGLVDCFERGMKGGVATKRKALKNLASTYHRYENYVKAIETIKEALVDEPNDASLKSDLKYYEEKLQAARDDGKDPKKDLKLSPPESVYFRESFDNYYALCRGDVQRPPSYVKRLKCRWKKTAVPYRPAKQEFLNIRPPIVLYHDVISDQEMLQVRELAKKTMMMSGVTISADGTAVSRNDMRVSETSWLDDSLRLTAKLSRRVEEITGLSTNLSADPPHAEPLQVLSYGVGGMYTPHYDFLLVPDPKGDRIATWMFYGNDVKVGGRTVFPLLNVSVPVSKGSAAFWPNRLLNGTDDWRTLHAGCPVAIGSKWVMNKWLRDYGQFNKWPCSTYKHKAVRLT